MCREVPLARLFFVYWTVEAACLSVCEQQRKRDMANTREYMDYLDEAFEIAPANSEEEYQASEVIAGIFREHGLETTVEGFDTHPTANIVLPILMCVMFACLIASGLMEGATRYVTLIVAGLCAAVALFNHFTDNNVLDGFGPASQSQNVVAVHRATGDKVVKGARPIVIVAHYDTPRESLLRKGPLARYQSILRRIVSPMVITIAACILIQVIPILPGIIRTFMWIVSLLCSLPVLFVSIADIYEHFAPCTSGSNDNKSSVAALLSIANKVRPAEDRVDRAVEQGSEILRRRAGDQDVITPVPKLVQVVEETKGVRHGADVLLALGILPPTCDVVYEEPRVTVVEEGLAQQAYVDDRSGFVGNVDEPMPERDMLPYDDGEPGHEDEASNDAPEADWDGKYELEDEPEHQDVEEPLNEEDYDEEDYIEYGDDYDEEDYDEDDGTPSSLSVWLSERVSNIREFFSKNKGSDVEIDRGEDLTASEQDVEDEQGARDADVEQDEGTAQDEEYVDDDVEEGQDREEGVEEHPVVDEGDSYDHGDDPDDDYDFSDLYPEELYLEEDEAEEDFDDESYVSEDEDDLPVLDDGKEPEDEVYEIEDDDQGEGSPTIIERIKNFFRGLMSSGEEDGEDFEEVYDEFDYDEFDYDEEEYEEDYEAEEIDDPYAARHYEVIEPSDSEPDQYVEDDLYADDEIEVQDAYVIDDEYDGYDEYEDYEEYEDLDEGVSSDDSVEEATSQQLTDPNLLHFDYEEDEDILPRDTTGLDTISDSYDLYSDQVDRVAYRDRPQPVEDPSWGVTSYQPPRPSINIARRAALLDLPDPSEAFVDPLASYGYGYGSYEEGEYDAYNPYDEQSYEDEMEEPEGVGEELEDSAVEEPLVEVYEDDGEYYEDDIAEIDDETDDDAEEESEGTQEPVEELDDESGLQPRSDHKSFWGQSGQSNWKGGATQRMDIRDDDPIVVDIDDLQDAILELGDEYLVAHDIWFVATGASETNHAGIRAFIDAHRKDIRGAFLVNLDSIGAGSLSLVVNEGLHVSRRADRRLVRLLTSIAQDLHIQIENAMMNWTDRESTITTRSRIRSVTITGIDEDVLPAYSHTMEDVPEVVDPKQVSNVVRMVTELIRRS